MNDLFDARVTRWLVETSEVGPADGVERALAVVGRTRQRPGWAVADHWRDPVLPGMSWPTARFLLAALLSIALIVATLVAGAARRPSADELVRLSQAVHRDPPPFSMTTTALSGSAGSVTCPLSPTEAGPTETRFRFLFDGASSFRAECLADGRLSEMSVTDGDYTGLWADGTWSTTAARPVPPTGMAFPAGASVGTVPWLNWIQFGELLDGEARPAGQTTTCGAWVLGRSRVVAGRPATEVACGDTRYWIDDASRLLVRLETSGGRIEALSLEVGIPPQADLLAVRPPTDVRWALEADPMPPDWTLPLADGGTLTWSAHAGRPVVVLVRTPACGEPCLSLDAFATGVEDRLDEIHALAIADRSTFPGSSIALAAAKGIPVAVDDGSRRSGWLYSDGVMLFDAQLRHRGSVLGGSADTVAGAVDALFTDGRIPPVPPGDGAFRVGRPAPPFASETLDGDPFDIASLLGRPVVVLSPAWETAADTAGREATAAFVIEMARARELVGDRAAFLVVAWREGYSDGPPDGWREVLDAARSEVGPVAEELIVVEGETYGSIEGWTALAWIGGGFPNRWEAAFVVLDADGRVARLLSEPLPDADEIAAIVTELEEAD